MTKTKDKDTQLDRFCDWLSEWICHCPLPLSHEAIRVFVHTVLHERIGATTPNGVAYEDALVDLTIRRAEIQSDSM